MTRLDQIKERLQHAQQMQMLNFKVFYEPDISYLLGEVGRLTKALTDIQEMFDGEADIDNNGGPNRAMAIDSIVDTVLPGKGE